MSFSLCSLRECLCFKRRQSVSVLHSSPAQGERVERIFFISLLLRTQTVWQKCSEALVLFALEEHCPFIFGAVKPPPNMSQSNTIEQKSQESVLWTHLFFRGFG